MKEHNVINSLCMMMMMVYRKTSNFILL